MKSVILQKKRQIAAVLMESERPRMLRCSLISEGGRTAKNKACVRLTTGLPFRTTSCGVFEFVDSIDLSRQIRYRPGTSIPAFGSRGRSLSRMCVFFGPLFVPFLAALSAKSPYLCVFYAFCSAFKTA